LRHGGRDIAFDRRSLLSIGIGLAAQTTELPAYRRIE
jgi:hypothetical protein